MNLYSLSFSPYASRCRIQVLHKNLPVTIVPPPGGLGSAELKAKNPIGKIPVLDLGDQALAESWAIMEYLEARFPAPPMRPTDPLAAARLSELVRYTDLQLAQQIVPMFRALRGTAGPDAVNEALKTLHDQLRVLDTLLLRKDAAVGLPLDLADAALMPVIWYAQILVRHFGKSDCLSAMPVTRAWWERVRSVPACAQVLGEMETGLRTAIPVLFA